MSTDNEPNMYNDSSVNLVDEPTTTLPLNKQPKGRFANMRKSTKHVLTILGILLATLLIWLFLNRDRGQPQTQAISPTQGQVENMTPEQQANRELLIAEQKAEEARAAREAIDPLLASLPPDDYVFSATPVNALTEQSTRDLLDELPEYIEDGRQIVAPDGSFIAINDPYLLRVRRDINNSTREFIVENRLLERRTQDGVEGWFIRTGDGFNETDYVPIETGIAAQKLRGNMRKYTAEQYRGALENAPFQQKQVEPIVLEPRPEVRVDPALTQEERDRLLKLIDTQRTNNQELVYENNRLREEQVQVKEQVVQLVQRLEDSSEFNTRLRAVMLSKSNTGWEVMSINNNLIYLQNAEGEMITLSQGDKLPDTRYYITNVDEPSNIVLVSKY